MINYLQINYITPDGYQKMELQLNELIDSEILSNEYACENSEINTIQQQMCRLRSSHDLKWAELAAQFYTLTAISLLQKGEETCLVYFDKATSLYQWMCEESRFLHVNYFSEIKEKREEIEQKLDYISLLEETWSIIREGTTLTYIESIIDKLENSGFLYKFRSKAGIVINLIEYDANAYKNNIPTLIKIIYLLQQNNLMQRSDIQRIEHILEQHIAGREKKIADIWFSNAQDELELLLKNNILETSAFILLTEGQPDLQYPKNVLSARICRYLARFESRYSDQLKNKAYTLLTGECTLNERLCWDDLLSFDLNIFIGKMVNIRIEELNTPTETDEPKWAQYSNGHNVLTLDKDGFTLSNLFPQPVRSWKGKKDRAALLDNRIFVVSFDKPTFLFDRCKNIAEHYMYWKQFQTEFPLYQPDSVTPESCCPANNEKEIVQPEKYYPAIDDEVTIGIVKNNLKGEYWEGIILDKSYRGMKAILPYTQFNACYFRINGFQQLFSVNDSFKARVIDINSEGIRVSLSQCYNEYVYPENIQKKQMPAMLADCEDGKLKWLLPTGATAVTSTCRWIKPHIGDFYKIEFQGTSGSNMRSLINVCQVKAPVTEADFLAEVMRNLQEFVSFIKEKETTEHAQRREQDLLRQKNNPFALLEDLKKVLESDKQPTDSEPMADSDIKEEIETASQAANDLLSRYTAEELIYCLDLHTKDITDPVEQLDVYSFIQLLCQFAGHEQTAAYYQICADYLYNIHMLTSKPASERFTTASTHDFNILQARMEQVGIERYASTLEFYNQIILLLCSIPEKDKEHLHHLMENENKVLSECARYFSMLLYLTDKDCDLQEIIYKHINELLGFKEIHKKKTTPVSVFFGHEGVDREFKTSALIHSVKNADEVQFVVLARVLSSFMNTDGGTLYIGVNDSGYLNGLEQDLKMCHFDSDVYLRSVNIGIIRQLGEGKEEQNRYQDYIRCALHEYNDGRLVLAFRVPPLNEVVKVNGNVYTRSGSSSIIKPQENIKAFIIQRRNANLDSTPCKPEFPILFNEIKQEYVFDESVAFSNPPVILPVKETVNKKQPAASVKKKKAHIDIRTSALRSNPLQKKAEMGYTSTFQFVSFFTNGKIACSPSPKIGVWGEADGKVVFSYDTEGNEELLISVLKSGEVGISNLKKGFSQAHTLITFLSSINDLLFAAPATKSDYILLIAEKEGEKRYRIISLADFEKSMSIQPKLTTTLSQEKGTYVYAEILHPEQIEEIGEEKLSINSFDIYNAGRLWEHEDYKNDVDVIARMCNINF